MTSQSILVGGLGKGGKGYYALDITNPLAITTEAALASKVMWEFPKNGTAQEHIDDMGYSFSRAVVVESNDTAQPWIVIFGNGYNSENGNAVLFILDPVTGSVVKKLDTQSVSNPDAFPCNGMSSPVAIDPNFDGKADYVLAGDLNGNMWKFDLSSTSFSDWDVAFKDGSDPMPLFTAKGPGGFPQPITTKPDATLHCREHGFIVIFGTGKYLGDIDFLDPRLQTIYGIWDYGDDADDTEFVGSFERGATPQLSNLPDTVTLLEQTIEPGTSDLIEVNGQNLRILSRNSAVWETENDPDADQDVNPSSTVANNAGWYFDLPITGERIVSDLIIRTGKVVIVSFRPEDNPCGTGGNSVIHEMDTCTGGRLFDPQFDINNDGVIDQNDLVNIGTEENPEWVVPTGIEAAGRLHPPAILRLQTGKTEVKYFSTSLGGIVTVVEAAAKLGMTYWREIN
jgi:type IV pilus assembly protein PilY1